MSGFVGNSIKLAALMSAMGDFEVSNESIEHKRQLQRDCIIPLDDYRAPRRIKSKKVSKSRIKAKAARKARKRNHT